MKVAFALVCALVVLVAVVEAKRGRVSREASGRWARLRCPSGTKIVVQSARYGGGCRRSSNKRNNLQRAFWGLRRCSYKVLHQYIGDPSPGCRKRYDFKYTCKRFPKSYKFRTVRKEASGRTLRMSCQPGQRLHVIFAAYGYNCGRSTTQTHRVRRACNNKRLCAYRIDHRRIGDPARGCAKKFRAVYRCKGKSHTQRLHEHYRKQLAAHRRRHQALQRRVNIYRKHMHRHAHARRYRYALYVIKKLRRKIKYLQRRVRALSRLQPKRKGNAAIEWSRGYRSGFKEGAHQ